MIRWLLVYLSCVCLQVGLLAPSVAYASGFYLPGRGAYPMGRAGAHIAQGETLQALWYNPANLAALSGFHTLLDAGLTIVQVKYQRASRTAGDGRTVNYPAVENEADPLPNPSLMLAYGWKKPNITVAYGLYAPYATPLKFPDTGPQRYSLVDLTGSLFVINQLSIAWAPHPRFRVGIGLQAYTAVVRLVTGASAYIGVFGAPEDENLDLYAEASITAPFAPSGNVGVWGRVIDQPGLKLDLAASVQLPAFLDAQGSLRVRLPTHPLFDPTTIEGSAVKTSLWFPMIIRGAVGVELFGRLQLEAAFVFEGWSVLRELEVQPAERIIVRDVPTIGDYTIPGLTIERSFQDAFSIRIGGSFVLTNWLDARVGYAFEKGAIPDRTFSVFLVDSDKHLIGAGISIRLGKHFLDLSYGLYINQTRRIVDSEVKQLNPLNPEGSIVVGNGTYESMVHIIGLGWRARF